MEGSAMKKYRLYFTAGMLAACMASAAIPKLLTADAPHLFVSAADQEISESMTLQADMTVDGNLTLSGGTLQLNGHTLTVKGDFWHKAGTISVSDGSTLIIKKNYELRAGYAAAGSGEPVSVPIRIRNNPGIAALSLDLSYDSKKLRLLDVDDGKILGSSTFQPGKDLTRIPYTMNWDDLTSQLSLILSFIRMFFE